MVRQPRESVPASSEIESLDQANEAAEVNAAGHFGFQPPLQTGQQAFGHNRLRFRESARFPPYWMPRFVGA